MRTIKFRGRHLCGQWYYGNLIIRETDSPVMETNKAYRMVLIGDIEDGSAEEIEEETVGQFTGLHDAYGNEIYEGDIVEFVNVDFPDCVIVYDDGSFMYRELGEDISLEELKLQLTVEVIGNIHDNPELLE